jgi:hypothetical protein
MINTAQVLNVERLRDLVEELRVEIRKRYRSANSAVSDPATKKLAAEFGERWLVEIAGQPGMVAVIGENKVASLSVHFQRLITYSERNTHRKKYDEALNLILKDFRTLVLVPLKASLGRDNNVLPLPVAVVPDASVREPSIVFVGQSFSPNDKLVNDTIFRFFTAVGFNVLTGEKPQAGTISKKVIDRIEQADIFVGIFTRRDKIENKNEWSTSAWVIEEKVYAYVKRKKLILILENGVSSIGGILGDYEYMPFDRNNLADLVIRLAELYKSLVVIQS